MMTPQTVCSNHSLDQLSSPASDESNLTLALQLKQWYNDHNVSSSALRSLLKILKPLHSELPLDPTTLLGTKSSIIEMFPNGEFVYFGLEDGIKKNLHIDIFSISTIKLDKC